MEIIQKLIPATNTKTRPGKAMVPKYITIHETDNDNKGADALAHAKLQERGNDRTASWHLTVDDKGCYQSVPFNEVAYAAGDGANGPGNTTSIHIEMCVNCDGNYQKTAENTAGVVKQLMSQFNIPLENVVQHNKWSGKNCPSIMRSGKAGITWPQFQGMCKGNQTGWVKEASQWCYYAGGVKKSGWLLDNGKWFYLNASGVMQTGWVKVNTKWYYLDGSGAMKTGWIKIEGKWYYCDTSGAMKTGWLLDAGKWYYLKVDGSMATGTIEDKGKLYHLNSDGSMLADTRINVTLNVDKSGALKP
ncbi:N-acetylmuramoyl-L-alanine amidase [Neobacillus sp. NPDC058068]|uniref:peptidoglycan recognition protein family protein n=1 Tax=Neobacillus sp. NPDC058068 TaxID=3346325 RepID=UPI0036DB0F3B